MVSIARRRAVALTALLRDASLGLAWLILDGDAAVGYIVLCFGYSLEWLGRDAFVDEFYLREEYRGRGWGRTTMEFVEEAATGGRHSRAASRSRRGKHLRIAAVPEAGIRRAPQHIPVEMDRAGFLQARRPQRTLNPQTQPPSASTSGMLFPPFLRRFPAQREQPPP